MGPFTNHLGRTKVAQLLAAVGSAHVPEAAPSATPRDWRNPHCFNSDQHNRLVQALGQIATRMADVFARARAGNCEISLKSFTGHFAGDLCRSLRMDEDFCLAFGPDQGPSCGFVALTPQTASAWATRLLGDSDSGNASGRALSALEESLLCDFLTTMLQAFLAPLRPQHNPGPQTRNAAFGEPLKPLGPLCQGQPELQFELTEEVAQIVLEVKTAGQDQPSTVTFLLPCSHLTGLAGQATSAEAPKVGPQELSRTLMEHLQAVPVTITAVLASTTLTFQEVLELGPGDILLLDKPVDGPAQLVLDGRTVFRGCPARSEGKHAVVIVEAESVPTRQRASADPLANQRKDPKGNA